MLTCALVRALQSPRCRQLLSSQQLVHWKTTSQRILAQQEGQSEGQQVMQAFRDAVLKV
jgi:hypothetical protein